MSTMTELLNLLIHFRWPISENSYLPSSVLAVNQSAKIISKDICFLMVKHVDKLRVIFCIHQLFRERIPGKIVGNIINITHCSSMSLNWQRSVSIEKSSKILCWLTLANNLIYPSLNGLVKLQKHSKYHLNCKN